MEVGISTSKILVPCGGENRDFRTEMAAMTMISY